MGDFVAYAWQGLVGPAGMPDDVVKKLDADLKATLESEAVSKKVQALGVEIMPMTSSEFKAYSDKEREDWAKIIKAGNITLQ